MIRTLATIAVFVLSLCTTAHAQTIPYTMWFAEAGYPTVSTPGSIIYKDALGSYEAVFGDLRYAGTLTRRSNGLLRYTITTGGKRTTLQIDHPQYYHDRLRKWRKDVIVDSPGISGFSRILFDGSDEQGRRYVEVLEIDGEPPVKCSLRVDDQNRIIRASCEAPGVKYGIQRRQ